MVEPHLDAARPTSYCALAEVHAELGRLDETEQLLRTAIDLDAQQAHIDHAEFLHHRRNDLVAAEREYRLADELSEPAADYHLSAFLLDTEFELVTDP